MTGFDRKRIDEIRNRLSGITDGEWKAGEADRRAVVMVNSTTPPDVRTFADIEFIASAPDDIRFLLDLVEHFRARVGECDVDPEVAKLTGRVRLLEGDVSNLKTAVDELRRAAKSAPFSPENKRLGGHPPGPFEPAPWEE